MKMTVMPESLGLWNANFDLMGTLSKTTLRPNTTNSKQINVMNNGSVRRRVSNTSAYRVSNEICHV